MRTSSSSLRRWQLFMSKFLKYVVIKCKSYIRRRLLSKKQHNRLKDPMIRRIPLIKLNEVINEIMMLVLSFY